MFEFNKPDLFSADGTCMNIQQNLESKQYQLQQQIKKLGTIKTRTPVPTAQP